jgi:hypothetical protein
MLRSNRGTPSKIETYKDDEFDLAFSYFNMSRCSKEDLQIHCGEYYAHYDDFVTKGFNILENKSSENIPMGKKEKGLKFHISIANIDNNIEKAWNIVKKYIIQYDLLGAKVIWNDLRETIMRDKQAGKEIVIYAYMDKRPPSEWQKIIHEITLEFISNNISPNRFPGGNFRIKGSKYFSYRNDSVVVSYKDIVEELDEESNYSSPDDEMQHEDKSDESSDSKNSQYRLKISESVVDSSPESSPITNDNMSSTPSSDGDTPSDSSDDFSPFRTIIIDIPNQLDRVKFKHADSDEDYKTRDYGSILSTEDASISESNISSPSLTDETSLVQSTSNPINHYSFFSRSNAIDRSYLNNRSSENDSVFKCLSCCVLQ